MTKINAEMTQKYYLFFFKDVMIFRGNESLDDVKPQPDLEINTK